MKYDKSFVRKKSFLLRKKKYLPDDTFNFQLIFKLIKKHFGKKKITIAGYYPSSYEVNILKLLELASEYEFSICLPIIKSSSMMDFKYWKYKDPLNIYIPVTTAIIISNMYAEQIPIKSIENYIELTRRWINNLTLDLDTLNYSKLLEDKLIKHYKK